MLFIKNLLTAKDLNRAFRLEAMRGRLSNIQVETLRCLDLIEFRVDLLVAGGPWLDLLFQLSADLHCLKSLVAAQRLHETKLQVTRMTEVVQSETSKIGSTDLKTLKSIVELTGSVRLSTEVAYVHRRLGLDYLPSQATWRELIFQTDLRDREYYRDLMCREVQRRLRFREAKRARGC